MVFVFVELIFIPATEHASENLSRACWRPFWVESTLTLKGSRFHINSERLRRCAVNTNTDLGISSVFRGGALGHGPPF